MESFFSRYKNVLVLIAVLFAQLLALAVQVKRPAPDTQDTRAVTLARFMVVTVIAPPERWIHNLGRGVTGLWFGYIDLVHVRRDDAALKAQVQRLRLEQASIAEDAKQGRRLQAMLGFKEHYIYKTLPAQVIGTSGTELSRVLLIDKGSDDGLKTDMPVVTAGGIVGKVKDVFPGTSQVVQISDPTSGVGVMLEATRIRGVLKGGAYGQVQVINVSPDSRIRTGEKIVTSGGDQVFPRGLPVGTVDSVVTDPDRDPLEDVIVKPAVNLSSLEEVLVITNLGDETSAQEQKDLAASEAEGAAAQKRAADILAERLPSRVDPNAPSDTNPDPGSLDAAGNALQPLQPPKTLHPDGFSPGATPPATDMTPGARHVPVLQGTEESAPVVHRVPAPASVAAGLAPAIHGAASPSTHAPTSPSTHAPTVGAVTGGPAHANTAAGLRPETHAAVASALTGTPARPAVKAAPGPGSLPVKTPRPALAAAPRPATPASGKVSGAGLKVQPGTRVIVDGPDVPTPARRNTLPAAGAPASVPPASRASATTPRTAAPGTTAPRTAAPGTTPPGTPPPAKKRKGPELVPDDGSRPPPQPRRAPATAPPGAR